MMSVVVALAVLMSLLMAAARRCSVTQDRVAGSTPSGLRVSGSAAWLPSCFPMEIAGAGERFCFLYWCGRFGSRDTSACGRGRWRRSTLREAYRRMGQQCLVAAFRLSPDSGRCRLCACSRRLSCRQQSSAVSKHYRCDSVDHRGWCACRRSDLRCTAFTVQKNPGGQNRRLRDWSVALLASSQLLFEWLFWCGFPLLAIHAQPWSWLSLAAPAMMYWLLVHVSGIPRSKNTC